MATKSELLSCGIVMPISAMDGRTEVHWADVLDVIADSISQAGFSGELVSNADDIGVIHKRIIQNLYENPVVVCDVSAKNPNVMFELGLRLAFDKPTIIVKDDETSYSFDTSGIEHLEYPRDMRFSKIVDFKKKLSDKIKATYEKSKNDPNYTTFLKHFGEFKVAKIESKEVSGGEYMLEELKGINNAIARLERNQSRVDKEIIFSNRDYISKSNPYIYSKFDKSDFDIKDGVMENLSKFSDGEREYLVMDVTDNKSIHEYLDKSGIKEFNTKIEIKSGAKKANK